MDPRCFACGVDVPTIEKSIIIQIGEGREKSFIDGIVVHCSSCAVKLGTWLSDDEYEKFLTLWRNIVGNVDDLPCPIVIRHVDEFERQQEELGA